MDTFANSHLKDEACSRHHGACAVETRPSLSQSQTAQTGKHGGSFSRVKMSFSISAQHISQSCAINDRCFDCCDQLNMR